MRREKINLVAELGYCLKTEVFLCCQITDILSENKNKTQCIAPASIRTVGVSGPVLKNKMKIMRRTV